MEFYKKRYFHLACSPLSNSLFREFEPQLSSTYTKAPHFGEALVYGGEREMAKNFSSFLNALRRRKCGDTFVSPAPPCQTPFFGSSNLNPPQHTPKPRTSARLWCMAERGRFELPVPVKSTIDFESTAFDHSAISPRELFVK